MKSNAGVVFLLAVVVALSLQNFVISPEKTGRLKEGVQTESAYDRVMRTNTLRCAYAIYPPFLAKDANTGQLSGVMPDILAEFEKASGFKVEWGPEIDWGNIGATLQTGKADAFCTGMFLTPKRARAAAGTVPLFYGTVEAFARSDDKRFDNDLARINKPDVRVEVNAGDLSEEIAQRMFPKATLVYKGELGGESQLFMDVAMNKADLTLSAPVNLSAYNQNNPSMVLRKVEFARPLMAFGSVIPVAIHEQSLLHVINATFQNLVNLGVIERIMRQHTGSDYGTVYFAAKPQFE